MNIKGHNSIILLSSEYQESNHGFKLLTCTSLECA